MRGVIDEIIEFQRVYSDQNTSAMRRRGQLIRDALPEDLRRYRQQFRDRLAPYGEDADTEGRDGTGRKTLVPWVRLYSPARSPSAQHGWYLVYLFHPEGAGVSLCLSHGSTVLQNGTYVSRSDAEVAELMDWAAAVVGREFEGDPTVRRGVALGGQSLARAYERTTVFSKFYPAGAVPSDDRLEADLLRFCDPLKKLYRAQELGLSPGETHVDRASLDAEIAKITAPLRSPGQGRGLSGPLRKLIELHAMTLAKRWLDHEGFKYRDVSASESCDFRAQRNGAEWAIEVKGTTGGPGSVLLTRNEVALHREAYPLNALIIVHGIELDAAAPRVSGGEVVAHLPWKLEDERLSPICFEYKLGGEAI